MAYVRKVKTASGATAVQIVEKRGASGESLNTSAQYMTKLSWRC